MEELQITKEIVIALIEKGKSQLLMMPARPVKTFMKLFSICRTCLISINCSSYFKSAE